MTKRLTTPRAFFGLPPSGADKERQKTATHPRTYHNKLQTLKTFLKSRSIESLVPSPSLEKSDCKSWLSRALSTISRFQGQAALHPQTKSRGRDAPQMWRAHELIDAPSIDSCGLSLSVSINLSMLPSLDSWGLPRCAWALVLFFLVVFVALGALVASSGELGKTMEKERPGDTAGEKGFTNCPRTGLVFHNTAREKGG